MKTAVVDLDGVICEEMPTFERSLAQPVVGAREDLMMLRNEGWTIIIHTARSWAEYEMTLRWLYDNSIAFDQLVMGKPMATMVIDDRAVTSLEEAVSKLI